MSSRAWTRLRVHLTVSMLVRVLKADLPLLYAAVLALASAHVVLRLFPWRAVAAVPPAALRLAERRGARRVPPDRVCRAVERGSKYIPGTACLQQALGGQLLLAWFGHEAVLRLGVARDPSRGIFGHAWLERDGDIILGATEGIRYVPLSVPGVRA